MLVVVSLEKEAATSPAISHLLKLSREFDGFGGGSSVKVIVAFVL